MKQELKINSAKVKGDKRCLIITRSGEPHHLRNYENKATFLEAVKHEVELWVDEAWGD